MQGSLTSCAGKTRHALRRVARLLAWGVAALVLAASREPVLGAGSGSGAGAWALVWVDGRPVPGDQGAYMVNGTLMLPARVLEQAGATLRWDARTKTATLARDGHQARATVGQAWLAAGGKRVLMPQPPELVDGQLMVPIRAVAQALGITVRWDGKTGRVDLETAPAARRGGRCGRERRREEAGDTGSGKARAGSGKARAGPGYRSSRGQGIPGAFAGALRAPSAAGTASLAGGYGGSGEGGRCPGDSEREGRQGRGSRDGRPPAAHASGGGGGRGHCNAERSRYGGALPDAAARRRGFGGRAG
ncbi:MAG: copper amine oxidase N-terminal domain-containing protein [Limnochordaceae bacterium]|nr:copper amine oxidase N-terminal domain-containing protein [Limnochordaceae bacterium]